MTTILTNYSNKFRRHKILGSYVLKVSSIIVFIYINLNTFCELNKQKCDNQVLSPLCECSDGYINNNFSLCVKLFSE